MIENDIAWKRQIKRRYLLDLIKSLKYITRQGIALQGHNNNDNFIQLLHLLGTKNESIVKHMDEQVGYKCNHLVQSQVQPQQVQLQQVQPP